MLESNHYAKQAVSECPDFLDLVINAEVLEGCNQSCPGCFINTANNNSMWEDSLNTSYEIAKYYISKGARFREFTLTATDFFTAKNTDIILKSEHLSKILNLRSKENVESDNGYGGGILSLASAASFEGIDMEHLKYLFSILDSELYPKNMTVEFIIPLNIKKVLEDDKKYLEDNINALNFFRDSTPKHVIYSYTFNIHNDQNLKNPEVYEKCYKYVKNNFDTVIENNPGFFRVSNQKFIKHLLKLWKKLVNTSIDFKNYKELHMTCVDERYNSFNTVNLHIHRNEIFAVPFVYQNIYLRDSKFKIEDIQKINNKHMELTLEALNYANAVEDCSTCVLQPACVGRKVQNVMKHYGIEECVFPSKALELIKGVTHG